MKTKDISEQERRILIEALEDLLYKIALELENYKGGPMTSSRKNMEKKQGLAENLLHRIEESRN